MPWTPAGPCGRPGCPNLKPCPDHPAPRPWSASRRRRPPGMSGWEEQRRARRVLERGRHVCHRCGHAGADVADHVVNLAADGPDTEANMAPIHGGACPTCGARCHDLKTAEEARDARARARGRRGEG